MVHPARCAATTSPLREASSSRSPRSLGDPILPWLRSVDKAFEDYRRSTEDDAVLENYERILEGCVRKFVDERRYADDIRFIRVLVLYADAIQDFKRVFELMEEKGVGLRCSLMYEAYALFLVAQGELMEANGMYHLGISRNAEPIGRLKKIHALFLKRVNEVSASADSNNNEHAAVNPWSASTINDLLAKIHQLLTKYNGYCKTSKAYPGKVSLSSLQNSSRNKIIELGGKKYHIKGCSGQGGFAQVFKAYEDNNPEDVVALKIQCPAFPWEFYMYRQLDMRVPDIERSSFGVAHKIHIYSDWSILVTEYLSHGTLQDAINSYLVMQKRMEEVLCIFYTIEMLRILETLHTVGIIHGDFKPDNLMMCTPRQGVIGIR
ncbi:hypothetical protein Taro_042395 [Colocasia esculenta]|uniref:Mitotic checkpoint serine/threonine-protein kinase BUB1 n=1 Tax=Colocasia esculenta TaxID=4460 RepID=A0A843X2I2_COLES|nr:hypothetical protein [Colocasia esculenta]